MCVMLLMDVQVDMIIPIIYFGCVTAQFLYSFHSFILCSIPHCCPLYNGAFGKASAAATY